MALRKFTCIDIGLSICQQSKSIQVQILIHYRKIAKTFLTPPYFNI
jgi:hypothetical protein